MKHTRPIDASASCGGDTGASRLELGRRPPLPAESATLTGAVGREERLLGSAFGRRLVLLAVCALGVSSIVTQFVLMRELLGAFAGNELVLGIVLGNWLLLTGVGAHLGRTASRLRRPLGVLVLAHVLVAVLPIASVWVLRVARNVVFVRGAMVGIPETVASCFVLLLPYCLLAGFLLTLACRVLARGRGPESIGRVYFLDSIGDALGGLAFTFVLVHLFGHFRILYFPAAINLLFALVLAVLLRSKALLAVAVTVAAGLLAAATAWNLDGLSTRLQYAGQNVVYRGNSPYGDLVVTASAGQYNFIENGVPLFSTHNIGEVEQTVHYAMAQRPRARDVLLISGGVSGTAREILKYGVQRVDYVELDPLIIEVGRRYVPDALADERITVTRTDGRLFVKQTDRCYDVVIADLPDPSTSQLNRFYTVQFFTQARRVLKKGGVLSLAVGHYENYVSEELARLIAVTHRTLKEVFPNVVLIPGGRIYFLASDGELTLDIAGRIEHAGVATQLVTRDYLEATLTPDRLADVERAVSPRAAVNKDFSPVLYYYHLLHWMSRFRFRFGVLEGLLLAFLVLYLVRIRPVPMAIFTTGFAASTLVVVLMLAVQILCGSVYHKLGLIVTAFMAGLAIGSLIMNRVLGRCGRRELMRLEFAVAAFAGGLPLALIGLSALPGGPWSGAAAEAGVALLALILAVLVGMEFPLAGKESFEAVTLTAARIYTADYVGACLGALLVSTFLLPVIGVVWVCALTAALNCVSGALLRFTARG